MADSIHACVVLAAGKGTRMHSAQPKVLHRLGGCSMLGHVLRAVANSGGNPAVVVIGPDMETVAEEASAHLPGVKVAVQTEQRGTADAVKSASGELSGCSGPVVVLFGDTPLIRPDTIARMARTVSDATIAILGFRPENPEGYGRVLVDGAGRVVAIREHADASEEERAVGLCNSGVMAFSSGDALFDLISGIGSYNAKGEFYLTDAIALAVEKGLRVKVSECPEVEVMGINTRGQLAQAEATLQLRLRDRAMAGGATLIDPDTVYFNFDTELGADVTVEPNVVFGAGVAVEDGATIKAFSHLEGARVRSGATIGPFARLRPGADVGSEARVGNFVEIKNAVIEQGAKVNHLSYVGDAHVGANANIGAGTITCNYDGFAKHRTEIGAGAFIGSNSALVAPVAIGRGAYVGSGSVVTKDVGDDCLAVARGRQANIPGWAARFRSKQGK